MINAVELRIGNKVKSSETEHIYTCVEIGTTTGTYRHPNGTFVTMIHQFACGIPLTPELLAKSGFELTYTNDWWDGQTNPNTLDWLFTIRYTDEGKFFFYKNAWHRLDYLHQLQNLYFALTGTELTIEL